MTVIAAALDSTGAYIASDSVGTSDNGLVVEHGEKLVVLPNNTVAGFSGAYVFEQWIRREFAEAIRVTEVQPEGARWRDFVEDGVEDWRRHARSEGHGTPDEEGVLIVPGFALIVSPAEILYVQSDGSVLPVAHGYNAIGSGAKVALGSLHSTTRWRSAERRVMAAVYAACEHDNGCGGHVHVRRALR